MSELSGKVPVRGVAISAAGVVVSTGAFVAAEVLAALISPGPGTAELVSGWAMSEVAAQKARRRASHAEHHEFPPREDVKMAITSLIRI